MTRAPLPDGHVSMVDIARDADLARALARQDPTGPRATAVRARLRRYILLVIDEAEAYGRGLPDDRRRDIVLHDIDLARQAAALQPGEADPVVALRMLAESARRTTAYTRGNTQ
ncbi:DUF6415 family natural product biosynthesis protein [Streptomyces sp. NPDC048057]|uniref:DUF6415 family natural product biosynthesis protein n=1 Tax=Streptomyces sp. NPDC048057 TaxID=3155628 RepID=UPI0033C3FEEF